MQSGLVSFGTGDGAALKGSAVCTWLMLSALPSSHWHFQRGLQVGLQEGETECAPLHVRFSSRGFVCYTLIFWILETEHSALYIPGTLGNVEHGGKYQIKLMYKHHLQRTASSVTCSWPFGGVKGNQEDAIKLRDLEDLVI